MNRLKKYKDRMWSYYIDIFIIKFMRINIVAI